MLKRISLLLISSCLSTSGALLGASVSAGADGAKAGVIYVQIN
ncbi:MAG TPA: hypothetical protein VJJ83_00830 [Candidatus Babeliales bacterium]|nr:hypothetical protein [Candidatus Babeliales bacterium]